jgi:hypothetical protein
VRERRLLYGQKWADFIATGTYYSDGARNNQEKQIPCESESKTSSAHQNGADNQHAPPPYAIRSCGEVQRNDRIAEQRQGKEQARLGFIETQAEEVED